MSETRARDGWVTACAIALVVMATWTLVVKFLVPVLWAAAESARTGKDVAAPVMWDFWWVAHLALAWMLWKRYRFAWEAALAVAVTEVVIVVIKFVGYFRDPDASFFGLLWLTNKVYVLGFFLLLLALAFVPAFKRALAPPRSVREA